MTYSKAIKQLRLTMCLTQEEFGKLFNVTFGTVNRWENGKYNPTMKIKRQLIDFFNEYKINVNTQIKD